MSAEIFSRLAQRLENHPVPFRVSRHEPVYTSAEAAAIRGTTLSSGAKALICKADDQFALFVMPADRKLASKLLRKQFGFKSIRFATAEEVLELTGLKPGSIPPFGSLFELPTYCDARLGAEPEINFNAGDHAISIAMSSADYLAVEAPQIGEFSE
jgi:Ala-tRNA(Pro) deacylase